MIANAVEVNYITDALFEGREHVSRQARILAESIEGLCLPSLLDEAAMLLGAFNAKFGLTEAIRALKIEYGEGVADRLGISFTRGGLPNMPGTYVLLDRVGTDLYSYYNELQLELLKRNCVLIRPQEEKPKSPKVQ